MKTKLVVPIVLVSMMAVLFGGFAGNVSATSQTLWYGSYVNIPDAVVGGNFYQTVNQPEGWGYPNGAYTNSHNTITISVFVP